MEHPFHLLPAFSSHRKLKPDARPVESPEDPYRLVSGADCRLMAFESVQQATTLWIKGREFTVARLLGDAYRAEAERYTGGSLCIFRLAPQDYHRFHSPVDGVIGPMTCIAGEYYTVNVSCEILGGGVGADRIVLLLCVPFLFFFLFFFRLVVASSYPDGPRCVWRECKEDRSY